ncbi:MAG: hypothetical protein CL764_00560 [Chloroflexi bacterium]|nr:hypothetical protein [Chloroflexota bacterium]|tara:strand:- start:1569 stop:2573 length:1005 start_codon:yes stop_codon:yes gene_type:complete
MITLEILKNKLQKLPRYKFAHLPTPLEKIERLGSDIGTPNLWVKREDTTGLVLGGNKARHYEFEIPHIIDEGYDVLINIMDYHSNNARMTGAAANKFGIPYVLISEYAKGKPKQGNMLIDVLLGAEIHALSSEESKNSKEYSKKLEKELLNNGKKPYLLQEHRFPSIVGIIAYINATLELNEQFQEKGLDNIHIFGVAGRSLCGLVTGSKNLGLDWKFTGIRVSEKTDFNDYIFKNSEYVKELLDLPLTYSKDDFPIIHDYIGDGYGILTPSVKEAILKAAKLEGLLVDPNYSGPVLASIIDRIKNNQIDKKENVVFLHTGGLPSLFSYSDELT